MNSIQDSINISVWTSTSWLGIVGLWVLLTFLMFDLQNLQGLNSCPVRSVMKCNRPRHLLMIGPCWRFRFWKTRYTEFSNLKQRMPSCNKHWDPYLNFSKIVQLSWAWGKGVWLVRLHLNFTVAFQRHGGSVWFSTCTYWGYYIFGGFPASQTFPEILSSSEKRASTCCLVILCFVYQFWDPISSC